MYFTYPATLLYIDPRSNSAASETRNPRRNIAKAIRRVFYRILTVYVEFFIAYDDQRLTAWQILGIFVAGLIVSSVDRHVSSLSSQLSGTARQSPFVIAIKRANIKGLLLVFMTNAMSHFFFCSTALYSYCWHVNKRHIRRQLVLVLFITHPLRFGDTGSSTPRIHLLYQEGLAHHCSDLFGKNEKVIVTSYR